MTAPMQHGSSNTSSAQAPKPPVPGGIGSSPTSMQSAASQDYKMIEVKSEQDFISAVKKLFHFLAARKKKK